MCRRTPPKNLIRLTISLSAILGFGCLFKDLNWAFFFSSVGHDNIMASPIALSRSKVAFCTGLQGTSKSTVGYCSSSYVTVQYFFVSYRALRKLTVAPSFS